ncbi:aldehyde dehydrogenase [Rhodococcus sp. WS1]|uniref:aldehyde dehydrogenase n=1 Tax=unclassified Rhodococcus (in: high G+C Gram-positive bacteria) TaxID=192944 RepID=UPI0011431218|nr:MULTISPECIES: aldehyde dehydrogenase [unclassified Rhodococcus (in: high G+C Gram-positive bacteria)]ROZ52930.1 aldehyde dehydrogenase [Rhodococcus sp. WS1]TQC36021.1 aldehyde dehydrogenase [Rhodococcus sp. WS7]
MVWQGNYSQVFIGGRWINSDSRDTLEVVSPFTEQVIATVPAGSKGDIDAAVTAARTALETGPWSRSTVEDRIAVLQRLSSLFERNEDLLATLVTDEMGCPITLSTTLQSRGPRNNIDNYIDVARTYPFTSLTRSSNGNALVVREPVGVVAAVIPWNAPQLVATQKIIPALLAGCTVILKPSPETPLDSYLLAEMVAEAGFPDGVVNIVPADRDVSEYLVSHPGVDKVTFTGSTAAGRRIASVCGNDLRRVTLELGGKSAAVVLNDADLDTTIESLRTVSFRNSGQICSNKTRIIVSKSRESELLDRLRAMVESYVVGDPTDPATQIGPLVTATQRSRVEGYIASGRSQGATLVAGGGRPAGLNTGWFVEPTIFTGVDPSMVIAREEIFGPVVSVLTYEDEDQAVALANDSDYGLNGSVFTTDIDRGLSVARRLRTGVVELNGHPAGINAPIGGFKCSGIGREQGSEGFGAYTEIKSIGISQALADTYA